ncbi:UNVERIFIED_CONTAM: Plasmodesmata-located protein 7, partial [Sesamum angustifolium]
MENPAFCHHRLPILTFSLLLFCTCFFILAQSSLDTFLYGGCSQLSGQFSHLLRLQQVHDHGVQPARRSLRALPVPGGLSHAGLRHLRGTSSDPSRPFVLPDMRRRRTARGVLREVRQCFFHRGGGQDCCNEEMRPSNGFNEDEMSRRDAVLSGLNGAGGPYRVGGSEDVQGVAQCTGDLSMGQCQDCLTEAIRRLKAECGGAAFGDMFLAKCYARYSTSGAHFYAGPNHDSLHHGESEKTFAIIIGLLAGVALLIIFLTFVRRMFGGNGETYHLPYFTSLILFH